MRFTDQQLQTALNEQAGEAHWAEVEKIDFGATLGVEESLKRDLQWVQENPLLRDALKQATQGFIFDLKTGRVEKVEV
ncbi:hypothetical protein ZTR_06851 [Talaromyces verruculosus]|nr:hypothetical protein ZTR_06851 [Talaromyces verruculosus]